MSEGRVEALLALTCGNMTKFALALEKDLYEDDTTELTLPVHQRRLSSNKVNFIREVHKYLCLKMKILTYFFIYLVHFQIFPSTG